MLEHPKQTGINEEQEQKYFVCSKYQLCGSAALHGTTFSVQAHGGLDNYKISWIQCAGAGSQEL